MIIYLLKFILLKRSLGGRFNIRWHDDVIKWKHFPCYWTFVRGIHRSPMNSPHKGQWRGALMFSLICAWINRWINREAGDLRRHRTHYDVTIMKTSYDEILQSLEATTFSFKIRWYKLQAGVFETCEKPRYLTVSKRHMTLWCHNMDTLSALLTLYEWNPPHDDVIKWEYFRVTGPLCGEFTGHRWIPLTKASDAELCCFFDLCLNKPFSKQSWGWWFERPSRALWRNAIEENPPMTGGFP